MKFSIVFFLIGSSYLHSMNLGWKHLAGQLLNGADLSKASLEEIDALLDEYPYFAGLHFLKAVKIKALHTDGQSLDYAKASLYFPNPHWFSLMLEHSVPEVMAPALGPDLQETVKGREDHVETVSTLHDADEQTAIGEIEKVETEVEPALDIHEPESQTQPDWEQNPAENPVIQQHQVSDEEQIEQEIWHQQASEPVTETTVEEIISEENFHIEPEPELEFPEKVPELIEVPVIDTLQEQEQQQGQEMEPQPVQEMTKPKEPAVADLGIPFEPLYTIDYFASQGIKIAAEASQKDQLSLKLRSFTEWLRAMKKLHPEKIDKDFNQDQEEQVRVIAESSNAPQIVYTEAMAEVFIKQGKKEKARQVFEKLSLLDPGKSAYFAVRIKELKEN